MLPIASLPAAALLLLRLGQPDMLGADGFGKNADWLAPVAQVLAAAGDALLGNLPMLFVISVAVLIGVLAAFIYPAFDAAFTAAGDWVTGSAVVGGFVIGTLNRLLVPFGLHRLLNSMPWFQFGDFTNAAGNVVHGDNPRSCAGDPAAGMFQAGFFPLLPCSSSQRRAVKERLVRLRSACAGRQQATRRSRSLRSSPRAARTTTGR